MIRGFFEDERTRSREQIDNAYIFDGLAQIEKGNYVQPVSSAALCVIKLLQ